MTSEPHFEGCEIIEKLRSGPATVWYLARQTSLGRLVIIKALSPNVLPDSAFAEPLAREAQTLSILQHKNIVQLYDFVRRDTRMWQVLEYVEGFTLDDVLRQMGKMNVTSALAIALKLTQTLQYVHARGVVHCDLQPKNILISKAGEIKLSNFYLAAGHNSPAPPELLEGDSGFASPSYLSPEQVLGEIADARSDLFSVGVLLYELVSAKRPFEAEDSRSTSQRIRHEPATPLSQIVPDIPAVVERIISRALSKLPADRFSDATEMARVLEQALSQLGQTQPHEAILRALSANELVSAETLVHKSLRPLADQRPILGAMRAYIAACVLLVGGLFLIGHFAADESTARQQNTTLELVPNDAAKLRAVARPWAHVFIDGQKVSTTPFATPIPLRPGKHYVRFDHPNAPSEHRTIEVHANQNIFLDVELQVAAKPKNPAEDLLKVPSTPDGGSLSP